MNNSYHETQQFRRCGLHAVNNFLQENKFTRAQFEEISNKIKQETQQQHHTYFIGNYDFNIIELALQQEGFLLEWVKQQENITEEMLNNKQVKGLLINLISEKSFLEKLCFWEPRHWISIRKIEQENENDQLKYIYMDSKRQAHEIKETSVLIPQLQQFKQNKENYILLIKKEQAQQTQQT